MTDKQTDRLAMLDDLWFFLGAGFMFSAAIALLALLLAFVASL